MTQTSNAGAEAGYTPASSLDTLDAFYTSTRAGQPMTHKEERAFLR